MWEIWYIAGFVRLVYTCSINSCDAGTMYTLFINIVYADAFAPVCAKPSADTVWIF